jgi:hypothetical protein
MPIERSPRNPRHRLARFAAVTVILAVIAACSGHDADSSKRSRAAATPRQASVTATSTATAPAVPSTTATPAASPGATDHCAEVQTWGSDPQGATPQIPDEFYLVRAGRHDCFDRLVFDVNGTIDGPSAVGYSVAYEADEVTADRSGEPVPTAGAAHLRVVLRAPALGYGTSGHFPDHQVGEDYLTAGQLRDWGSLREVTFAGTSEGQSTVAVGVASRLPFRVGSYERDGYSHVYVDVAHPH